jgi:tripartite-type tricarboxylate transporter receptor subunit TctC
VVLTARKPFNGLPGVPTVIEAAKKHGLPAQTVASLEAMADVMDMGHAFFAPPNLPPDRIEALRSAFAKTFQNKEFLAKAEKAGLYVGYQPAAMLEQASHAAFKHATELAPLLKTE